MATTDRWTLWRYVYLPTGEVTRPWVINEPPPAEPGPDGEGFELQVVEVIPLSSLKELRGKYDELRDVRFEEGCDECQLREDVATKALDQLEEGLRREIEFYREEAAKHRDEATRCKIARFGEEQLRRGLEDDTRADRLEALLPQPMDGGEGGG
jgi:hypothetical protein